MGEEGEPIVASPINVGDIVRNPRAAEWGRGRVVAVDGHKVHAVFEKLSGSTAKVIDTTKVTLELLAGEVVPLLEFLPPMKRKGGALAFASERIAPGDLLGRFLQQFPMGFDDPAYLGDETLEGSGERNYKLRANHLWNSTLGGGLGDQLRTEGDAAGLLKRIRDILKSLNLLAVQELIAFTDALKDADAVLRYASALFEYLRAPTIDEASFTPYLEAVEALPRPGKFKVVTWPVLTLLPFIARPTDHMFLKPSVTQVAAAAIGFDLQYRPEPNWLTYKRLIQMSERLMTVLRPHGARDLIDVQSFIWVAAGSA